MVKWIEGKHPHEPSVAEIQKMVRAMSVRQRNGRVARAKELMTDCQAVQEAVAAVK